MVGPDSTAQAFIRADVALLLSARAVGHVMEMDRPPIDIGVLAFYYRADFLRRRQRRSGVVAVAEQSLHSSLAARRYARQALLLLTLTVILG